MTIDMYASRKADVARTGWLRPFTANENLSGTQAQLRRSDYGGISTESSVSEGCGSRGCISVRTQNIGESHSALKLPNFPKRIRAVHEREGRSVRILSLCSGAAGIERQIIAERGLSR